MSMGLSMPQREQANWQYFSVGQTLAQMSLAWVYTRKGVTSVLIGASKPEQIKENVEAVYKIDFTPEQILAIEKVLAE